MNFPDCRHDDYYNADFLDKDDGSFIQGFDAATETVANIVDNDFEFITDESDYLEDVFKKELPEHMQTSYERYDFNGETETHEVKTYGEFIFMKILEHLEEERDSTITSLIDHTSESEESEKLYQARRNKVLKENATKKHPKEYYDTRHAIWTGEKVCDGPHDDDDKPFTLEDDDEE